MELTFAKGIKSKTLQAAGGNSGEPEADLAGGDKTYHYIANQVITDQHGKKKRLVFKQSISKDYVKNLGEKYLHGGINDEELEQGLQENTKAFLNAKKYHEENEKKDKIIQPIYTHVPARK